jgi:hypothetical protein
MQKDNALFTACKGTADSPDGGRKYWMVWERGMLGATAPEAPIENPPPFREGFTQPPRIVTVPTLPMPREWKAVLDSYRKPYDYPPIECADLSHVVRHLTFHVWPVRQFGAWQWNCDRLLKNADLFNGRRIVAITTSNETDSVDEVRHYLRDFTDDFIVMKNDARLREVITWVPILKKLEGYQSESDVTFSCHAKGVRHLVHPDVQESTLFDWTDAMYETCLCWDAIHPLLEEFATVGSFRTQQSHMTQLGGFGPWHYSGSFFWWRNRDAFRRNWMYTPNHFFGTEAWPGIMFAFRESGVVFADKVLNLYEKHYFDTEIKPALEEWRKQHKEPAYA